MLGFKFSIRYERKSFGAVMACGRVVKASDS